MQTLRFVYFATSALPFHSKFKNIRKWKWYIWMRFVGACIATMLILLFLINVFRYDIENLKNKVLFYPDLGVKVIA